ncbi:MAG: YciI family protein [Alphaproteobacteria bacterium]|nr:YciI family protein [Alphaproteobacteria bacterium]
MSIPKVTKQDVLNASSEMLNKDLYVVFTKPENGMKEVMENLEEHLKFQVSLEKNGVMFGAGPFWEDNEIDWNGEGMVIIRANSLNHAKQIAASDPMHQSGARNFTVRPWLLNEGNIQVSLDYSTGKFKFK